MKSRQLSRSSRKTIEKYINTIKKELPIYGKHERKYLRMLSGIIYDYAEASENATITTAELISNFGDPKNCAYEYIEALDSDAIYYNMGIRRYGRYLFLTALSIMLAFTLCVSFMMYKEWQISRKNDIASTTIILQDGVITGDLSSTGTVWVTATPPEHQDTDKLDHSSFMNQ